GPMWFAAVLLLLSLLYGGYRVIVPGKIQRTQALPGPAEILTFIVLMAGASFVVRIYLPEDRVILNVHPGDLPQYILMFAAGTIAYQRDWLERVPTRATLRLAAALLIPSAVLFAILLIYGGVLQGKTSRYAGGLDVVSFGKCAW